MKSLCYSLTLLVTVLSHAAASAEDNPVPTKTQLVWEDNFDGDSLDFQKWGIEINAFGGGNQELQIYTDAAKNVRVENGNLILEAHKGKTNLSGTEREYSSGRIRTKNRGDWKYGRIEVRAKLPIGAGIWPAIWMLATEDIYGGWASSGEIDIMEYRGQEPNKVLGTLHYGAGWPNNKYTGGEYVLESGDFHRDFHVFAVEWREGIIKWYVDGKLYQTQTKWSSDGGPFPAPFDQKFYLVLNLAVGGHFVGNVNRETQFPQKMLVDYVRVYR